MDKKDENQTFDLFEEQLDWNDFSIDEKFEILSKIYSKKINQNAVLSKEKLMEITYKQPRRFQKLIQAYNNASFEDLFIEHSNILYNSTFFHGDIAFAKLNSESLKSYRNDDFVFASSIAKLLVGSATMLYGAKHSNWALMGIGGGITAFGLSGYFKPYLTIKNQIEKLTAKVQISKLTENLLASSHILNNKYEIDLDNLNNLLFKEIEIEYLNYAKVDDEEDYDDDNDNLFI